MNENPKGVLDALSMARYGPQPFDPEKDSPQDVGLGGLSTEYLMTAPDSDGVPFNFPSIWWMDGKPMRLSEEEARNMALDYENRTGKRFPRFNSFGSGSFSAMNRSAQGGATNEALAQALLGKK